MAFEEAMAYFARCLGSDWQSSPPLSISGWRVIELLWPLNPVFRQHLAEIRSIRYLPRFAAEADAAIIAAVDRPISEAWAEASPGAWRVLLERHQQMVSVAMANERAGQHVTAMPHGLDEDQQRAALMLLLLLRMKLPFPIADRSRLELPDGPPPSSFLRH